MSGNLKKCCLALLLPPPDYYAKRLKEAFQGLEAPLHRRDLRVLVVEESRKHWRRQRLGIL